MCLLLSKADDLSPYDHSVELVKALEGLGMPYKCYAYERLSHYFATTADYATTLRMFQDLLDCPGRFLKGW